MLGALGVAIGTLLGACVGVCGHVFYNMRRTTKVELHVSSYIRDGLLRPILCSLPVIACVVVAGLVNFPAMMLKYLFLGVALITGFLVWRWGLVDSERKRLRSWPLMAQV